MDRESQLELVRTLTREVMAAAQPDKLATFAEDFGAFAVSGGLIQVKESAISRHPREQVLDTMLVAGMFFQVLLEAERLPAGTSERVSYIRRQAKNFLVTCLAGQITLSQFFRLLNLIEENVQHYFADMRGNWVGDRSPNSLAQPACPREEVIRTEALHQALEALPLNPKGRRKFTALSLGQFLDDTQGDWFRLLDFEEHFGVNKKTAWAYLNQLLQAGILEHNGEKANKVRYTLASRFRR